MYRLLVVDDEEIIVNGLYDIFGGLDDLELDVYKAYSGQEAIDWLSRTRMDVVVSDINMPGINGLELLAYIQANWPRCRVVFLSGHEEFLYVYEAIKHPNVTYILKSENPDRVVEAIRTAIDRIENDIRTEDLVHQAKEQIEQAKALFQSDFLLCLMRDDSIKMDGEQLKRLSIPLHENRPLIIMIGQLNNLEQIAGYAKRIETLNAFRLLVGKYLSLQVANACVLDDRHQHVWLLQPFKDSVDYGALLTFLSGTLESVLTSCEEKIGLSASFALSARPLSWDALAGEYAQLTTLLEARTGLPGEILYGGDEEEVVTDDKPLSFLRNAQQDARALDLLLRKRKPGLTRSLLEMGDRDRFFESVNPLLDVLAKVRSKHSNLAAEAYFDVSMALLTCINRWQLEDKMAFRVSLAKLSNTDLFDTWSDGSEYLREVGEALFTIRDEDEKTRAHSTIAQVNGFILDHIGEDLSLVRLAELVHLNPSYLSRLYKQVTGGNVSDYIDILRIRSAKGLLGNDRYKVQEVASLVGYDSAASFSRFFRRASGLSPQEYRDMVKDGKTGQETNKEL